MGNLINSVFGVNSQSREFPKRVNQPRKFSVNKKLLKGSLILLVTFNVFNLLNLFYNFSMVRILSLADYGILTTLIYIIIIFAVFSESIQTVVSRYTTKENDLSKVKNIVKKSLSKAMYLSIALFLVYLIVIFPLSGFLRIPYSLMALTGFALFTSLLIPVTRGTLQGRKRFKSLGKNMILEGAVKLVFSIIFALIGFKVYGAVLGLIIGTLSAFILSFISLKDILKRKEKKAKTPEIYEYSKPVFMVTAAIILFLSLDIILAKRFFPAELVGAYAISSTIAKIIFIGTQPISRAMFPISTETKEKSSSKKVLLNSLVILLVLISIALLMAYNAPSFLVKIYSGKIIAESISILFYLSAAMGFLSMTNLILLYKLSLGSANNSWFLLIFVVIEAILLSIFNASLLQFSLALLASSIIFLLGSLLMLKR